MAAPLVPWPRRVAVALTLLVGVGLLGYYTAFLYREELRDWRVVEAWFEDVGGLRKGDQVLLAGTRAGRVAAIELVEDRQLVRLEVLPEIILHEGTQAEVVAANSLGYVEVRLTTGPETAPLLAPGDRIQGRLAPGLAQGTSVPGRRRLLAQNLRRVADATREIQDPESGTLGQLLFDRDRALSLQQGMKQLEDAWRDVDAGLARVEAGGGLGAGLDPAGLDALANTMSALRQTLGSAARGLRDVRRGEGTAGRFMSDPTQTATWRRAMLDVADQVRDVSAGRGTLGRLSDPRSGADESLRRTITALDDVTTRGVAGEGILGVLSSPRHTQRTRRFLRRTPEAMEAFSRTSLVRDGEARESLADTLGDLEDRIIGLRRGAMALRANQASRTYVGAIFAVF